MFEEEAEEYKESKRHKSFRADVGTVQINYENYLNNLQSAFKDGAEFGYNKANEYAKTIIQDLLDNSDEYARQRAIDFLKEEEKC